jgi:hypothetical protein
MTKNILKTEGIIRVILGVILGMLALLQNTWHGSIRMVSAIAAMAFIITAFVGY